VIVLSAGALSDDKLRVRLEAAALKTGALLYVPSGGIGGLDALKAACIAGVDSVEIIVSKPPRRGRTYRSLGR
jgi:aspartate dehydrogenase